MKFIKDMKDILVFSALITLAAYVLFNTLTASPKHSMTDTRRGSIVRLTKEGRTFCTGVVVNNTTIITASHCVLTEIMPGMQAIDTTPINIRLDDNIDLGVEAKPYAARVQLDQALLMGDFSQFKPRRFITSVKELNTYAKYDQHLTACGYPMGGPLFCSQMYFQDLYDFMWSTQGLLLPGMSGGPVMLPDGTVVAINIAVGHNDANDKNHSIVSPIYNIDLQFRGK